MAILIGVIALAVIPNIQRSRESKDLTTLDNVLSSTNIAIANNKISSSGDFSIDGATFTVGNGGADATTIMNAVKTELTKVDLGSSAATKNSGKIFVSWTAASASSAAKITVEAGASKGSPNTCDYTSDPSVFKVTN